MPVSEVAAPRPDDPSSSSPKPIDDLGGEDSLRRQLLLESDAMARYAFAAGLPVPAELLHALSHVEEALKGAPGAVSLVELGSLHNQLAAVVAPALPQTIYLLQTDRARNNWLSVLGPLPTVRRLMLAALFFTLVFVVSSLSPSINVLTMGLDIYRMDGLMLLNVLVFLMSAAGMGATFHALFTAHSYIADGSYDPRYESSYWTRIGLGVIAGMVISQIVPFGPTLPPELSASLGHSLSDHEAIQKAIEGNTQPLDAHTLKDTIISKPVLALLGGFSATMVYSVMQRLVDTLESLFKGNGTESRDERKRMSREIVAQKFGARVAQPSTDKVVSIVPPTEPK
jgi:hypothetical protein